MMNRTISFAALRLGALAMTGCAATTIPEEEGKVDSASAPFIELAAEAELGGGGEQGGCSNRQIRHCVDLCKGTVDACYDPGDSYTYECHCRKGGVWTATNNPSMW